MGKIITVERNTGDLLSRMKGSYIGIRGSGVNATFLAQHGNEVNFMARYGQGFTVRDNETPAEVFGSAFNISVIPARNLPQDSELLDELTKNQNEVGIDRISDGVYLLEADFSDMFKVDLEDSEGVSLGDSYWVGLVVTTGKETIVGIKLNGVAFTEDDVLNAQAFGAQAGSFVLWIKAELGREVFVLEYDEKETGIVLNIQDTHVVDVVAPHMISAVAGFEDDVPEVFEGNSVTVFLGSVLEEVVAQMGSSVYINGTPKAMFVVEGGDDLEYGTIAVSEDDDHVVLITPIGTMGSSENLGVHNIKIPADSVRHRGVGNAEIVIEVTVVENVPIEVLGATAHFVGEIDSQEAIDGIFTVEKDSEIEAIDVSTENNVTVVGVPVVTLTVGEGEPTAYGVVIANPETSCGFRIDMTGDMGINDTIQEGLLTIPAGAVIHRDEASVEIVLGLNVIAAPEPDPEE